MSKKNNHSKKERKIRTAAAVFIVAYVLFAVLEAMHIVDFLAAEIILTLIFSVGSIILSILIRKDQFMTITLLVCAVMGFFYIINLAIKCI